MSGPSDTKEGFYAALAVKFCVDDAELKRAIRNPEEEDAEPPAPEELVR